MQHQPSAATTPFPSFMSEMEGCSVYCNITLQFEFMAGRFTVIAIVTGSSLLKFRIFVCLGEEMIALSVTN
jgi:hypothetical protein